MSEFDQIEHINELYHDELFEEAIIECHQLLASTSDPIIKAQSWRRLGDCQHELGQYQAALEAFKQALAIKTGDSFTTSLIYLSQALTYQELHDFNKAQAAFEKALDLAVDSEDLEHIKEFWEEMLFDMEEELTEAELSKHKQAISGDMKKAYRNLSKSHSFVPSSEVIDWSNKPVLKA